MRRSKKPKTVSWASDVNLCQVRLFISEETPSEVGLEEARDHLQEEASNGTITDDNVPPGFEGAFAASHSMNSLSQIPFNKWRFPPPRFVFNPTWQVVAGEESKDVGAQNRREMSVLEAVYPRLSSIPPNPSFPAEAEKFDQAELQVPLIPITPIENDGPAVGSSPSGSAPLITIYACTESHLPAPGIPPAYSVPNPHANEPAAISAAISKSNEQGRTLDHEVLMKTLTNSKLVEKLLADRANAPAPLNMPKPPLLPANLSEPPPIHVRQKETLIQSPKSANYYSSGSRPKITKPCIYFNSSKGCRHGANCAYQHDSSSQRRVNSIPEAQSAKRMKMDGEIPG